MQTQLAEHTQSMRALGIQIEETEKTDLELTKRVGGNRGIVSLSRESLSLTALLQTASLQEDIRTLEATVTTLQQELHSTRARLQHTMKSLEQHITTLEVHPVICDTGITIQFCALRTVLQI